MNTPKSFSVVSVKELSPGERFFIGSFSDRVIGQPGAVQIAQLAYRSYKNPLRDKSRPIGVYYLVGPSRTGKSLTAEVLAEIFHGRRDALIRIQASDYEQDHQILDIKGAPPSYLGYRDPHDSKNRLDESEEDPASIISTHNLIRARRGSKERVNIIVIEEFEKSSYDFYKLWMGVFDKGCLKLANSQNIDFSNTIFILTSNLATDELEAMTRGGIGFGAGEKELSENDVRTAVQRAMKQRYRREFRNRLDATVIFRPLNGTDMKNIVDSEVRLLTERIMLQMPIEAYFVLTVADSAKTFLLAQCGTEVAELKRVINRELLMPLGRLLDEDNRQIHGGDIIRVSHDGQSPELCFEKAQDAQAERPERPTPSSSYGNRRDDEDKRPLRSDHRSFLFNNDDFID